MALDITILALMCILPLVVITGYVWRQATGIENRLKNKDVSCPLLSSPTMRIPTDIILRNPQACYDYAREVLKGRWIEGEESIKKDPALAVEYAINIRQSPWPEAEEFIKEDPLCWSSYELFRDRCRVSYEVRIKPQMQENLSDNFEYLLSRYDHTHGDKDNT